MSRRTALIALLAAALVAPATAAGETAPAATSATPTPTPVAATAGAPRATLSACEKGADVEDRAAVFTARMAAVPGSARLQVRFTLQTRTAVGARWRSVKASGFQRWISADAGVTRFVYSKRVEELLAPAGYRATVAFRWKAADGSTVASTTRTTKTCSQPDLRPDLEPAELTVQRNTASGATYTVTVENAGRGDAPESLLELAVATAGAAPQTVDVPALEAGESTTVTVTGPACAEGASATVTADPDDDVEEADEADNERTTPCPVSTGAGPYNQ